MQEPPEPVPGLPRMVWIVLAVLLIGWQVAVGRSGVGLLAAAALLPLAAMPPERGSRHLSPRWLAAGLAPLLGTVGLAGAFPALAGQAVRWRQRLVLGALGYWWLMLAQPLLSPRLWFGAISGTPARAVWEGSIQSTATHVIGPLLTLAVLAGALLWGVGALLLPLLVRGRSAVLDLIAAALWSVAIVLATTRVQEAWEEQQGPTTLPVAPSSARSWEGCSWSEPALCADPSDGARPPGCVAWPERRRESRLAGPTTAP